MKIKLTTKMVTPKEYREFCRKAYGRRNPKAYLYLITGTTPSGKQASKRKRVVKSKSFVKACEKARKK